MTVHAGTNPKLKDKGVLLMLHGRGARGADLMPLESMIGLPDLRWIFPDGHLDVPLLSSGRAWYDISTPEYEGLLTSRRLIFEWLDGLGRDGVPPERIILGGFSQGAVASLDAGLRYPRRIGGIIGMSGFLAWPERLEHEMSPTASGIPILLTHGKNDDVLPVEGAREAQAVLRTRGFDVRLKEYLMAHEVIPEVLDEIRSFVKRVLGV